MFCGNTRVGTVDGVYAEGTAEVAEYLSVRWTARENAPILVATRDVETLTEDGVILMGADPAQYEIAPPFEPANYPTMHRLGGS